jgi:class I fructose-bisphosphate aldolase/fructose-bisphosphate aldolase/2-amino-3,7-dideoxy-D-threo-hept-6-ulosonate synthase
MIARLNETGCLRGKGVILQLNGMISSAAEPHRKEMLSSIDTALRLGADAVSVDLVFDGEHDSHNLKLLGTVADEADAYGLPLLAMVKCLHADSLGNAAIGRLRHVVRAMWELGTDAVKLQKPASLRDIPALLDGLAHDIDVFFAGGPRSSDDEIARLLTHGLNAGAKGLCVGRNVFQNVHPEKFLTALNLRAIRHADAGLALVGAS